jgi:hypothetical protein
MSDKFSKQLIEDFIDYWHKRWNEKISADQAEQYLVSLSDLYLSIHKIERDKFSL